jgi:hypothetical protein
MKAYRRTRGIAPPLFLNLDTRWKWVVNFMPSHFTPGDKALVPTE